MDNYMIKQPPRPIPIEDQPACETCQKRGYSLFMAKCIKCWELVEVENRRLRQACAKQNHEIEQTLGRALGYPRYADDQENFPGVTVDDVCTGEHCAGTLAVEAVNKMAEMRQALKEAAHGLRVIQGIGNHLVPLLAKINEILGTQSTG